MLSVCVGGVLGGGGGGGGGGESGSFSLICIEHGHYSVTSKLHQGPYVSAYKNLVQHLLHTSTDSQTDISNYYSKYGKSWSDWIFTGNIMPDIVK